MTVRVKVLVLSTALLDSGCTRCLISPQMIERLGVGLRKLKWHMAFSQLDGLITGRVPATCLTKLVKIKVGAHLETIQFIVVLGMTEPMILGMAW